MIVETVPFVPRFLIGAILLTVPGLLLTVVTGSNAAFPIVAALTVVAALVRPHDSPFLCCVLCTMRTCGFFLAALFAFQMKVGGFAAEELVKIAVVLVIGGVAQWRISGLIRTNQFEI